ncbi:universal stress protein [Antrihabitans sp. YC2-6]|uniref:universal stress protein n=1 Tax=Antrihabitans sp. YC2-6 TaxID=2799498 RepID=UPI0018F53D5E|nr:universal stress protein [Antrihabitans sp. YC2-6]MBJ8346980.1 universal stress protein [Antrihabitans sp. YC2-6]
MTYQPIIVGVDGSPSSGSALRWAALEAATHHVPLHIVNSCADPRGYAATIAEAAFDRTPLQAAARKVLARATTDVAAHTAAVESPEVKTILSDDPAVPTLIDLSNGARMVVVGSRGLGAFKRGLLGSVSTAVARHAHCPVAVIHEQDTDEDLRSKKPVVVGVDGTRNSERAIEIAFDEASHRNCDLVALHAWADTSDFDYQLADWPDAAGAAEATLAESLAGWQEKFPDVSVRRIAVRNHPRRHLAEQAADAAVVVVGSHGRGGFAGLLLGSVSQALLHTVSCPLIIARGPA